MKTLNSFLRLLSFLIATCCGILVSSAQVPVRIMPLGDSITEGFGSGVVTGGYRKELHSLLTTAGFDVDYVGTLNYPAAVAEGWEDGDHEGHGGFTMEEIRGQAAFWLKQVDHPDVILLHIGTNDFWSPSVSLPEKQDQLRNLIAELSSLRPHARIIVASLIPRTDLYEAAQVEFNQSLPSIVAAQAALGRNVTFVDMHGEAGSEVLQPGDLSDGVHPNAGGYDKMAAVWFPAINSVLDPTGLLAPPAIASVEARTNLQQVTVTFSKPIKDADVIPGNFSLSPAVLISGVSLDSSKRVVTLSTGVQAASTVYTLAVSGIHDRTTPGNLIASGTTATFTSRAFVDGSFEQNDVAWVKQGVVEVPVSSLASASDGQKLVVFNAADEGPGGSIAQTIPTVAGQKYRLQFDMGVYASNTSEQKLQVTVKNGVGGAGDSVLLSPPVESMFGGGAPGNPSTQWQTLSFAFTAASAQSTILFQDLSIETMSVDLLLDDVRLDAVLNEAPVAVNDGAIGAPVITAVENSGAVGPLAVLANDSDPDGGTLTVTAAASPDGTVAINGDQSLSFAPEPGFIGEATISYVISDSQGGTDGATVWVETIEAAPFANGSFEDGDPATGALDGWTIDGYAFGYATDAPNGYIPLSGNGGRFAVFNGGDEDFSGSISQTFATNVGQTYRLEFDMGIGGGLSGRTQALRVEVAGTSATLPTTETITSTGQTAIWASKSYTFIATSSATTLTFSDVTEDLTEGDSRFADLLLDDVRVTAISGGNQPPLAVADGYTTDEDTPLTVLTAAGVLLNDTDDGPAALTAALVTDVANGTLALAADGSFTYTPNLNFSGVDTFTYESNDSELDSIPVTVTITVNPVNDAPVAVGDSYSTAVDTLLTVAAPGVLGNDTDDGPVTLTAVIVSSPSNGGSVTLNSDGSFNYTPASGFTGTETFTYKASDGGLDSAAVTVSIAVNQAQLFANGSFEEGSPQDWGPIAGWQIVGSVGSVISYSSKGDYVPLPDNGTWMAIFNPGGDNFGGSIRQTFSTIVGQTYTVAFDAGLGGGTGSKAQTLRADVTGEVSPPGTPRTWPLTSTAALATWSGKSFTFVAGSSSTTLIFTDASVYGNPARNVDMLLDDVRVTAEGGANQAPVARADNYTTTEETQLVVAAPGVLSNDTDLDSPAVTAILVGNVAHGTLAFLANGSFTYTPALNFSGTDSFTYKANDGITNSSTVQVSITVTPVNDAPVAIAGAASVNEDGTVDITLTANDPDLSDTLSFAVGTPSNGSVSLDGAVATYAPTGDYNGPDGFTFTVSDGTATSAPAAISITVAPVNDAPVAVNDGSLGSPFVTVAEDSGASAAILAQANDSDVDSDPLTITAATSPNGTVAIISSGTALSFTPALNFNGATTISYTISDGQGGTASATAFVTVTPVNDAPVAVNDGSLGSPFATVAEDSGASAAIPVLGNDSDLDSDPLTITAASSSNGTVAIVPGGTALSFTPTLNFNGATTISYTISDGQGGTASATVFVTVTPVNDAPVAVNDGSAGLAVRDGG